MSKWKWKSRTKYPLHLPETMSLKELQATKGLKKLYSLIISDRSEIDRYITRWSVYSTGKRSSFVRYIFAKWLWDELTSEEMKIFILLPEVSNSDSIFFYCLKARKEGKSKKLIRERLLIYSTLQDDPYFKITKQVYLGLKRIKFHILEHKHPVRPFKYQTGYTKNFRDKGSLPRGEFLRPMVTDTGFDLFQESTTPTLFYHFLSVGEIFFLGEKFVHPDENNWFETDRLQITFKNGKLILRNQEIPL